MFTPYNLALPTVLYPVREVPLFTHQAEAAPAHQNTPGNTSASDQPRNGEEIPQETNDHNEWSTFDTGSSTVSSTTARHGWLHLPHIPRPHIDLSYLRHKHVAVLSASSNTNQAPQTQEYGQVTYLPHSPLWPAHLFPSGSPFHYLRPQRSAANDAAVKTSTEVSAPLAQQSIPHSPAASVTQIPAHYVLELDTPGLPSCDSSSPDSTTTATISVTWLSPRTILVSGRTPASTLSLDDAMDGGELCRTPTREEAPPPNAGGVTRDGSEEGGGAKVLFSERLAGDWRRSFTLPSDAVVGVDPSEEVGGGGGLRWEVEDGVVRVWVPRA